MNVVLYCMLGLYLMIGLMLLILSLGIQKQMKERAKKEGVRFPIKTIRRRAKGWIYILFYPLYWFPSVLFKTGQSLGRDGNEDKESLYEYYKDQLAKLVQEDDERQP